MAPTIRIDDHVYNWLQSKVEVFNDTPNSVLRRLAGLDGSPPKEPAGSSSVRSSSVMEPTSAPDRRPKMANGQELIKRWGIPARQARFHHESNWYGPLTKFPAALCDREGYVLFASEREH